MAVKVDISSIREIRGGSISFEGSIEIDTFGLELDVELNQPVAAKGSVTNTGDGFLVQGQVDYSYQTHCDRCLEQVLGSTKIEVTEQFASYTAIEADESAYLVQGDIIDLSDCVREQVFLSLPMKITCKTDCRGLCPQCGQNLNDQGCHCHNESFNPQFLKLKSLLNQEGGGSDGKPNK